MTEGTPILEAGNLLRERARRLAHAESGVGRGETVELLEFRLASERYAFLAAAVDDVQPLRELTALPCTPAFLRGIVNVRGRLVPVYDLKRFFALPQPGITDMHRILLLRNQSMEIGILADAVEGVLPVALADVLPPPPAWSGIGTEYIRGITGDGLVVLDAGAILGDPAIVMDEEVP